MYRFGDERLPPRFWRRVEDTGTCWLWQGSRLKGYGRAKVAGVPGRYAHRMAYVSLVGPVPEGLELDHLCRQRCCVNPAHLEPVTHHENVLRGNAGKHLGVKTHCPRGHAYDEVNTLVDRRGSRGCRECRNADARARYAVIKGAPVKAYRPRTRPNSQIQETQ